MDIEEDWIRVVRLIIIREKINQNKATDEEIEYYNRMKPLLDEYDKLQQ